jgi:hypothetical protein
LWQALQASDDFRSDISGSFISGHSAFYLPGSVVEGAALFRDVTIKNWLPYSENDRFGSLLPFFARQSGSFWDWNRIYFLKYRQPMLNRRIGRLRLSFNQRYCHSSRPCPIAVEFSRASSGFTKEIDFIILTINCMPYHLCVLRCWNTRMICIVDRPDDHCLSVWAIASKLLQLTVTKFAISGCWSIIRQASNE